MVKIPNEKHPRGRLILNEIRMLAEKILQIESPGFQGPVPSNSSDGTREQHNSFGSSTKATTGDEWEEGHFLMI